MIGVFLVACGDEDECDFTSDIVTQSDGSNPVSFNNDTVRIQIAQRFKVGGDFNLLAVRFTVRKEGDPGGNLEVSIRDEEAGHPDDRPIDNGGRVDVSVDDVGTGFLVEKRAVFSGEPEIKAGREYFIVIESTEAEDIVNFFELGAVSSSGGSAYVDGEIWVFNSEEDDEDLAWNVLSTQDLQFVVEKCEDKDA